MPVKLDIADGVIALQMVGVYEPEEIQTALLTALNDKRSSAARGLLFDVSQSDSLRTRHPEDVRAMGYFLASHGDRFARRLALVGFDDFRFGMMRLGSVVLEREGVATEVFRDEGEAREWLHRS